MVVGHVMLRCCNVLASWLLLSLHCYTVITVIIAITTIIITICDDRGSSRAAVEGLGFRYRV
jgi:hypothetical protein